MLVLFLGLGLLPLAVCQLVDNYIDHFVVLPSHRFLFCLIEKNANSEFSLLFKSADPHRKQAIRLFKGRHPQDTFLWHNPRVYNISLASLDQYLQDPSWIKVVFYRDPLSRFLSAFRSKCQHLDTNDPKPICLNTFGHDYASFHEAVSFLYQGQVIQDPHFTQQYRLCGGLDKTLSLYQGVYELHPLTSHDIIVRILRKIRVPIQGEVLRTLRKHFPKVDHMDEFRLQPTKNIVGKLYRAYFGSPDSSYRGSPDQLFGYP